MVQKQGANDSTEQSIINYDKDLPALEALREEVVFILEEMISKAEIKIHAIESRVKTRGSLMNKLSAMEGRSGSTVNDLVGARIICLFKSDVDRLGHLIEEDFVVHSLDNKIESSEDSFGYMSVHYVCSIKPEYAGPRYDKIRGRPFEIQVRTLCMHAWAAISHYLDYKAEWDIPSHLKKGLNALSGLFYVADEQYESLFAARVASKQAATNRPGASDSVTPINLDTVSAFIHRKYSDRKRSDSDSVSKFVRDLTEAGYNNIEELDSDLDKAQDHLRKEEQSAARQYKGKLPFFTAVGAGKVSLRGVNRQFKEVDSKNFRNDLEAIKNEK